MAAGGPDRTAGRRGHRRRDHPGGPRAGRLHDRWLRPERGQPAPRGLRPGPAARRRGRRGHRRGHAERLLLRLHQNPRDPRGAAVVGDIGGTMPSGYCSDCTRTYVIGEPPPEFAAYYRVLRDAQQASFAAVRPGVTAEAVDAAARGPIAAAGSGEYFVHRTGHGIGLETHEDPYIVSGNAEQLQPGMAFSIEPGIYPGPHGARIEDIVVCT